MSKPNDLKFKPRKEVKGHYLMLGGLLRKARQNRASTMRDVADITGHSHSFVGKIENAERRLDVIEFIQYCKVLGVDPVITFTQVLQLTEQPA